MGGASHFMMGGASHFMMGGASHFMMGGAPNFMTSCWSCEFIFSRGCPRKRVRVES